MEKGLIHLYTGEGKGKTTAAVGLAVRAAGAGKRVMFLQFMKGRDTGELHALDQLPGIEILRSKKDFGFYFQMTEEQKEELTRIHNELLEQAARRFFDLTPTGMIRTLQLDQPIFADACNYGHFTRASLP